MTEDNVIKALRALIVLKDYRIGLAEDRLKWFSGIFFAFGLMIGVLVEALTKVYK